MHLIETSDKPFYNFLSGGAGVGKSHLIKSLYQAALKYYNSSIVGANSAELRDKILKQIPLDPRKTIQLAFNLQLAEGERTEIAGNITTDDGITNGAGNIIRKIQLHDRNRPSGIIWVQFDHTDVGEKTRHDNRRLYVEGIECTWTPIKPVTAQFAVGKNRTAQVVRK